MLVARRWRSVALSGLHRALPGHAEPGQALDRAVSWLRWAILATALLVTPAWLIASRTVHPIWAYLLVEILRGRPAGVFSRAWFTEPFGQCDAYDASTHIQEGLTVYDREDRTVGTVERVFLGAANKGAAARGQAADVVTQPGGNGRGLLGDLAGAFLPQDPLPEAPRAALGVDRAHRRQPLRRRPLRHAARPMRRSRCRAAERASRFAGSAGRLPWTRRRDVGPRPAMNEYTISYRCEARREVQPVPAQRRGQHRVEPGREYGAVHGGHSRRPGAPQSPARPARRP